MRPSTTAGRTGGAALALAALLLGGCTADPGGDPAADPEGTWGSPDPGQPELTLEPDGRAYGTDGCNQFTGSWRLEGTEVTFVDLTSTLMACENVDDWFAAAETAAIDGDLLVCHDAEGREIGTLSRQ